MNRLIYCLAGLLCLHLSPVAAQCTIDSSNTSPGIYPDSLPPATSGQLYSQDITFVMLTDTLGLTISNYQITSIGGLPVGLTWTCNNTAGNCNYDPSASIFGCINISGTPLVPGSYSLTVQILVTIQIVGTQSVSFNQPLEVLPAISSNNGFTTVNGTGCAPLTVTFNNNLTGQASYFWDFGNGVQSTLEQPPAQNYSTPGTYVVRQDVTPASTPSYFLTDIEVAGIPNNYGGFVDDPDMYFLLYDPNGQQVYDSRPSVDNTFPPVSWPVPNIQLSSGNYSVHVWDEDGGLFGADDDLGIVSFNGNGASGTATGTLNGVSGQLVVNYTIFQTPINVQTSYDTIEVYANPDIPVITPDINPPAVCEGTLITLTCNDSINYLQWEENGSDIIGANTASYIPTNSGNYSITATNTNGCAVTSLPITVNYYPLPVKPTFIINNNVFTTFVTGYNLQWYLNGSPISGATSSSFTATQSGTYRLCATDTNGCENCSDTLVFTFAGIPDASPASIVIYPNPTAGTFFVSGWPSEQTAEITILNGTGQQVGYVYAGNKAIDCKLPPGIYLLEIKIDQKIYREKLVVKSSN